MELSPKSVRAAHLFTRMEMIKAKNKETYNCVMCCSGASSIQNVFRKNIKALHLLEKEREVFEKFGMNEKIKKQFQERWNDLRRAEIPLHNLRGFWKEFLEMIKEEGLDPNGFIEWCREYFYQNPSALRTGCYFADSGWEGWLYRAAMGAEAQWVEPDGDAAENV